MARSLVLFLVAALLIACRSAETDTVGTCPSNELQQPDGAAASGQGACAASELHPGEDLGAVGMEGTAGQRAGGLEAASAPPADAEPGAASTPQAPSEQAAHPVPGSEPAGAVPSVPCQTATNATTQEDLQSQLSVLRQGLQDTVATVQGLVVSLQAYERQLDALEAAQARLAGAPVPAPRTSVLRSLMQQPGSGVPLAAWLPGLGQPGEDAHMLFLP